MATHPRVNRLTRLEWMTKMARMAITNRLLRLPSVTSLTLLASITRQTRLTRMTRLTWRIRRVGLYRMALMWRYKPIMRRYLPGGVSYEYPAATGNSESNLVSPR